jgi:GT2 family glycosyltransferase
MGIKQLTIRTLVGIVSRNRAGILPEALDSALAQSASDLRVAVIDDASTDDTRSLEAKYRTVDWEFRPEPRGYMSARNEFMARDGLDFFVSLDDDSWFIVGDEITVALEHFKSDPMLAAVAFDIVSPDRPQTRARGPAHSVGMFIGCGHVLRLSAVHAVGAYVPAPGGYGGEEKDLCLRLLDSGYKVVRLPGVHVWHDKTPVARNLAWQHRSGVCNDLAMAIRRAPLPLLPAIIPAKIFRHLMFSWRAGLMAPCLSGLWLLARSLRSVWHWRQPVRYETLRSYSALSQE